jgi:hypothetical protein
MRVIKDKRKKWVKHVACIRRLRDACTVLVRKLEGKRTLG